MIVLIVVINTFDISGSYVIEINYARGTIPDVRKVNNQIRVIQLT
jgi:hypothetical protein